MVGRYPTNQLIGRGPLHRRLLRSFPLRIEPKDLCGISHPFGQLCPTNRYVTHALLSRLPLDPKVSFDLHVLGTPPAFTLSQDQTLHHECTSSLSLFETFFLRISLKRNQVLCSTTNGLLDRQRCTYGGLVHTSRVLPSLSSGTSVFTEKLLKTLDIRR